MQRRRWDHSSFFPITLPTSLEQFLSCPSGAGEKMKFGRQPASGSECSCRSRRDTQRAARRVLFPIAPPSLFLGFMLPEGERAQNVLCGKGKFRVPETEKLYPVNHAQMRSSGIPSPFLTQFSSILASVSRRLFSCGSMAVVPLIFMSCQCCNS